MTKIDVCIFTDKSSHNLAYKKGEKVTSVIGFSRFSGKIDSVPSLSGQILHLNKANGL